MCPLCSLREFLCACDPAALAAFWRDAHDAGAMGRRNDYLEGRYEQLQTALREIKEICGDVL